MSAKQKPEPMPKPIPMTWREFKRLQRMLPPILPRHYWIVVSANGMPHPHSFAFFRAKCLSRFLTACDYGTGGKWSEWYARGYRAVKCSLVIGKQA